MKRAAVTGIAGILPLGNNWQQSGFCRMIIICALSADSVAFSFAKYQWAGISNQSAPVSDN